MRSAGPAGPNRPAGPLRPEPADQPLHAAGARCCAPGAAWLAPQAQLASPGWPAFNGQLAGHGTAGRSAAPRRARGHGWRMAGRGLVTGGFLLCGWLVTGAGHAYAAQITAPAAPHTVLTAGHAPAVQRPASTPLAPPSFPGRAGVGAGNHDQAAVAEPADAGRIGGLGPGRVGGVWRDGHRQDARRDHVPAGAADRGDQSAARGHDHGDRRRPSPGTDSRAARPGPGGPARDPGGASRPRPGVPGTGHPAGRGPAWPPPASCGRTGRPAPAPPRAPPGRPPGPRRGRVGGSRLGGFRVVGFRRRWRRRGNGAARRARTAGRPSLDAFGQARPDHRLQVARGLAAGG